MSTPTPVPSPPSRKPWFGLSRRTLLLVAIAFGVGLVLFLLLLAGQRGDDGFFRAGDAPAPGREGQVFEPLPTPDAVGSEGTTRGARDDGDAAVSAGREEDGDDRFAQPGQPPELSPDAPPAAPPPPEPVASASPDTSARPLRAPPPSYPAAAARRGDSGTVLLQVRVDAQGRPSRVDVVQSSRSRPLDREAVRAVQQWTFSPAIRNGQPVEATVLVPVEFQR